MNDTKQMDCPYCGTPVLIMRSLNGRKVVVDISSVDALLCRLLDGRLIFDRKAGHVLHRMTCSDRSFDSDRVIDDERRSTFRADKQVKRAEVPHASAYRELQLDIGAPASAVKSAYRKLVFEYHPDRNPMGLHRIQNINRAYEELKRSGLV